jgi:2,3-bisphosphoglycerate-independent phosphoglycerate mutase
MDFELIKTLRSDNEKKIVMLVMDGLGGLPNPDGLTELEAARTPNFDQLAQRSDIGLHNPVDWGIAPGGGPAHLAIFGYDPLKYLVKRGALTALGIGFPIKPGDVACRLNFATIGEDGTITDRRAGRIKTELNEKLCKKLRTIQLPGVELFVQTEKDYRALVVLRGPGLSAHLTETDPLEPNVPPKSVQPLSKEATKTAELYNQFVAQAQALLKQDAPANMVLLRGFSDYPRLPTMQEVYGLKCAAIATYPMYKGVARVVGMDVVESGDTLEDEIDTLEHNWDTYSFFYLHVKQTDSMGEDGNFAGKVEVIETVDALVPRILALKPDVLIVTGDHSTPAMYEQRTHTWHPVPFLLFSRWTRPMKVQGFNERECVRGSMGTIPAVNLMPLAMAHAEKLVRYGA